MTRRSNNDRSRGIRRSEIIRNRTQAPLPYQQYGLYASASHSHSDYLPRNGGTVSGTLVVSFVQFPNGVAILSGHGNPEGSITAVVGSLYLRDDVSATGALYVKQTGTGNTGWSLK